MAQINVVVQNEAGKNISDAFSVSSSLFSNVGDKEFYLLKFIDPYGDTVFNKLQVPVLIKDLRKLRETCSQSKEIEWLKKLESLAHIVEREVHCYLKFIGD